MRVFVTDGENRAALAVTRSLGRAGHHVIVGEKHTPSLAHTSRYCSERVVYPDPVASSDAFVDRMAALVRQCRVDVILPVADITTFLVTRERERFAPSAVPFADADVVERAANKVELMHTAMRLGVPVPRMVVVHDAEAIPEHDLGYPVVIKPRQSRVRTPAGWVSSSVSYAATREDLARDLASRPPHHFPLMLQERIVGPGVGVFACYHEGKPVALFSHRRLRERPPWGGVSVLSESIPLSPRAKQYALALLDELKWSGVAMVEFKIDSRDDEPKLMEINGRFWGSLQLAIDAGVDFPGLLVQSAAAGPIAPQAPYRIGVQSRWLWGDIDSLLLSLFAKRRPARKTDANPGEAVLDFLKLWGRNLHYDNPKPDDVRPWFYESYRRVQGVARALAARVDSNGHARPVAAAAAPRAAATPHLHADVVGSLSALGVDAEEWNAIASRSDTNTVFQTHEWSRSWLSTFGDQYSPFFVRVANGHGVAGIAPFVVERRATERVVRLLGDGRADYLDFMAAGNKADVIKSVFDTLTEDGRWDVVELNNIPGDSSTVELVRSVCDAHGYRTLVDDQYPCPTLLIEGREDEALKVLNKPSLRRRTNYFNRAGRLVCLNLSTAAEVQPHLDAFFAQHVMRWGSGAGGSTSSSLFVDNRNRDFYRELTRAIAPKGWLLFSVVEFNDKPIAFHYGFDYNGSVIWYKPSFDVEFEQHSPGIVMVQHLIRYAIEHGRRELDFTVGDEAFKRRFTNATRRTYGISVFRDPARYYWECSKRELKATVRKLSR
jgi:CelD/BcsL family acetyltransferase involved in cellulose biosynthesis/predicted ATP-grasp superfamily ATP-dependent carboligase